MPIDSSIYGQIQPVAQQNPLNSLAQAMQIQHLQRQGDMEDRTFQQQNKLADLYRGSVGADGTIDRTKLLSGAASNGLGAQIPALQKGLLEQDKAQREAEKAQIEGHLKKFELAGQIMNGVSDQASWDRARQQTAQIFGPEAAAKMPPQYDPALVQENAAKAMTVKDQLEQKYKALTFGETQRHNQATEATGQGNLANAQGQLRVAQDRLAYDKDQPKGQVVQTDSGTMLVDPRTGEARPVTSNGQPVQKPGKEIPASVNKSIIENQQNLAKIDQALSDIKAKPGSLGPQYMIPGAETVGQYVDPEGVQARAGVADIGSLVLHDRSGAAVTVSEMPRLKPFIPTASDKPEVAMDKLRRFREQYAKEAELLSQTYSKDQGYKESPLLKSGTPKAADTAAPAKTKVVGGKTYANDGKGWYVVN